MTVNSIYLSQQIKEMDEGCGIDSDILMQNAAKAILTRLDYVNRCCGKICIVCGKGNNGGDGYALGCLLLKRGVSVTVVSVSKPTSALAKKYYGEYISKGGKLEATFDCISNADTVIDCIFGFSFKGTLEGKYADAVKLINESNAFVVAVDLPSGILADSDEMPKLCVNADITCTFTAFKIALVSYPSKQVCGEVFVEDIGIGAETISKYTPYASLTSRELIKLLPPRNANAHKGTFGTLAAICGSENMCGAAALSCLAALKSGVGLVRLYTDKLCALATGGKLYEAIVSDKTEDLQPIQIRATALLLGCGCGRVHDQRIKEILFSTKLPTVLDADGINCIAGNIELYRSITASLVITPHPAEMGRLAGVSTKEINASRVKSAQDFAKEYGFVTVLKGAATVIAAPNGRLCINTTGNTGLAKGGSGDVLAGLIASLLAQGLPCYEAACLGVYLHGAAADALAKEKGVYSMLPSELPEIIGRIMYFG